MATESTAGLPQQEGNWSPARIFMVVSAIYHVPLGIVGLAIDQTFPIGSDDAASAGSGHIFGIFEANGWHSLAALLLGLVSVYFAVRPERAREVALAIGIGHVFIVVSFELFPPETFWFASNAADQVIHAATAILGIGSGFLTRREPRPA